LASKQEPVRVDPDRCFLPNFKGGSATERVNENPLGAEDGLSFLTWKDKNETLVEGLLTPKGGEVLRKFKDRSKKGSKNQETITSLGQETISQ